MSKEIDFNELQKTFLKNSKLEDSDFLAWLKQTYLQPDNKIPIEWLDKFQSHDFSSKFDNPEAVLEEYELLLPTQNEEEGVNLSMELNFLHDQKDFKVLKFQEEFIEDNSLPSSNHVTNTQRQVGKNFIRGSLNQAPFLPGGFELEELMNEKEDKFEDLLDSIEGLQHSDQYKHKLPELERGIYFNENEEINESRINEFEDKDENKDFSINNENFDLDDIMGNFDEDDLFSNLEPSDQEEEEIIEKDKEILEEVNQEELEKEQENSNIVENKLQEKEDELDLIIPDNEIKLYTSNNDHTIEQNEWAHKVELHQLPIDYSSVVPKLAHEFPFELDLFQKHAVYHLEAGNSVFLAAHTSAGKTVVAEYAIALAMKHMTRAIYTSPIKALSNQKFRDFKGTFEEVGILTGDVQINPEASCLIMTTEILRSMLYRGADVIRDVEFVIFDEVHYLNDLERGVVWEEVIILLPSHINIILLSATVPNTMEFAEWIGRTKKKDIFVISTLQRPIPLEHYIYAEKELFKIVDKSKTFIEAGWRAAKEALSGGKDKDLPSNQQQRGGGNSRGRGQPNRTHVTQSLTRNIFRSNDKQQQNLWVHMIGFLKKKQLLPVIIFTFSKKRCDSNAANLPNLDLTSNTEKSEIQVFISKSLNKLAPKDRLLPQVLRVKELLKRGISVHHSGLLPVVKEMVEILFSRGLVKVLFATETFAMGVNMPARSVVFNSIKKHDGIELRYLLSGEYTQMSGRAGRRGLDKVGMVILACPDNHPPDMATLKTIILGKSNRLSSQFRLTYNMMLNLLRVEALKVEEMIKRSFAEDGNQQLMPQKELEKKKLMGQMNQINELQCDICGDLQEFIGNCIELQETTQKLFNVIMSTQYGKSVFCQGRVILLDHPNYRGNLAVIIKMTQNKMKSLLNNSRENKANKSFLCFILTDKKQIEQKISGVPFTMIQLTEEPHHALAEVEINNIQMVTKKTIEVNKTKLLAGNKLIINQLQEELISLNKQYQQSKEELIIDFPAIKSMNFFELKNSFLLKYQQLPQYQCNKCPDLKYHYNQEFERRMLNIRINNLESALYGLNLDLLPEYYKRLDVLTYLGFSDGISVTLKGRVGCEINSVNELVVTELILDNFFARYDSEESVALLSCFLFQEKSMYTIDEQEEPVLTPKLLKGCDEIVAMCSKVADAMIHCHLNIDMEEYIKSVNFGLVHVVYEWARGMSFNHITTITDVAEGSIVRTITRLDDTCRDVRNAARLIGDNELYAKMEAARLLIKRDIVFATSLYF
ncbi:antiviral helicase [Neoconidiobolus thromboides FSU 785]|nr:antiviral helicase [Neoconidiobolus thromboides FSU 785]